MAESLQLYYCVYTVLVKKEQGPVERLIESATILQEQGTEFQIGAVMMSLREGIKKAFPEAEVSKVVILSWVPVSEGQAHEFNQYFATL